MTFSLVGRCARTGMLGAAVATSALAVGSRCAFARAGVGAVLTQHRTDPRLGPAGIAALAAGATAAEAIEAMCRGGGSPEWRQLAAIDARGQTAFFHGGQIGSIHGAAEGVDCVAIGNILRNDGVPAAMAAAFAADPDAALATRLIDGLLAGEAAGGEKAPLVSAAVLVVHEHSFPYVDLRIDAGPDPAGRLRALWLDYAPQADDYVRRALDPDSFGPSQGR